MANKKVQIQIEAVTKGFENSLKGVTKQLEDLKKINSDLANQSKAAFDQMASNSAAAHNKLQKAAFDQMATNSAVAHNKLQNQAKQTSSTFGDMFKALIAKEVLDRALSNIYSFFEEVKTVGVKGASDMEASMLKLNFAMAQTGEYSKEASQGMIEFAESLKLTTTADEDQVIKLLALAKSYGATNKQAQDMTKAAFDMNAQFNDMDMTTAVQQLGATLQGTSGRLGRLNGQVRDLTDTQLKAGAAIKFFMTGAASTELDTYAGRVKQTTRAHDDLFKGLGSIWVTSEAVRQVQLKNIGIYDNLTAAVKLHKDGIQILLMEGYLKIYSTIGKLNNYYKENQAAIKTTTLVIGILTTALLAYNTVMWLAVAANKAWLASILALGALTPVGWIVVGITAAVTAMAGAVYYAEQKWNALTNTLKVLGFYTKPVTEDLDQMTQASEKQIQSLQNLNPLLDNQTKAYKANKMGLEAWISATTKLPEPKNQKKVAPEESQDVKKAINETKNLIQQYQNLDDLLKRIKSPGTENEKLANTVAMYKGIAEALKLLNDLTAAGATDDQKKIATEKLKQVAIQSTTDLQIKSNEEKKKAEEDFDFKFKQIQDAATDYVLFTEDKQLQLIKRYLGEQLAWEQFYARKRAQAKLAVAGTPAEKALAQNEINTINWRINQSGLEAELDKSKTDLQDTKEAWRTQGIFDLLFGIKIDPRTVAQVKEDTKKHLQELSDMSYSDILSGDSLTTAGAGPAISNIGWIQSLTNAWDIASDVVTKFTDTGWVQTLQNTLINVWDSLADVWNFAKKIFDYGAMVFNVVYDSINLVYNSILSLYNGDIINAISAVASALGNAPKLLVESFGNFAKILDGILNIDFAVLLEKLPVYVKSIIDNLPSVATKLAEVFPKLADALITAAPQLATAIFSALGTLIPALFEKLPEIAKTLGDVFEKLVSSLAEILPGVLKSISDALPGIMQSLLKGIGTLVDAIPAMVQATLESLPDLISVFMKGLPDIIIRVFAALPKIVTAIIDAIPAIIEAFAANIAPIVEALIIGIADGAGDIVARLIDSLLIEGGLERIVKAILNAIPRIALALVNGVVKGITEGGDHIGEAISRGWKAAGDKLTETFNAWGKKIADGLDMGNVAETLTKWGYEISTAFQSMGISETLTKWGHEISTAFQSMGISETLTKWGHEISEAFTSLNISDTLTKWGHEISEAFTTKMSTADFGAKGLEMWNGFYNKAVEKWEMFAAAGQNIWGGFYNKVVENWEKFKAVGEKMWSGFWGKVTEYWDQFTTWGKNIGIGFWNYIVAVWENFTTWGKNIGIGFWNFIISIWKEFENLGKSIASGFKNAIGGKDGKAWYDPSGWFSATGGQVPSYLATGGHPGNPKGTDTVPAWLTPGEFVINRNSALANLALLKQINSSNGPISSVSNNSIERKLDQLISVIASDRTTFVNIDGREVARATRKATEQGLQNRRY